MSFNEHYVWIALQCNHCLKQKPSPASLGDQTLNVLSVVRVVSCMCVCHRRHGTVAECHQSSDVPLPGSTGVGLRIE